MSSPFLLACFETVSCNLGSKSHSELVCDNLLRLVYSPRSLPILNETMPALGFSPSTTILHKWLEILSTRKLPEAAVASGQGYLQAQLSGAVKGATATL